MKKSKLPFKQQDTDRSYSKEECENMQRLGEKIGYPKILKQATEQAVIDKIAEQRFEMQQELYEYIADNYGVKLSETTLDKIVEIVSKTRTLPETKNL